VGHCISFFLSFFFILIGQENKNPSTATKVVEKKNYYPRFFLVFSTAQNRAQKQAIFFGVFVAQTLLAEPAANR
jgi:hypothetical protein